MLGVGVIVDLLRVLGDRGEIQRLLDDRHKLRRRALRDGRRLYARKPRAFMRRVARAYDAGAPRD